jgi:uncharacterized phage-associated protein
MNNRIHIKFNESKAINAILYITNRLKRCDFHKIFKILYFSDRNHLVEYGRPITGDSYIAMEDGPVPSNIYDIFKAVRGDGFFKDTNGKFSQYFSVIDGDLIKPKKQADLDELSATDLQHINASLALCSNMSWNEIREKSHDYAWVNTARNREIEFENIIRELGGDDEYINYIKEHYICSNYLNAD